MKTFVVLALLCLSAATAAVAQQASVPEPMLRVKLDPPTVVVGQETTLTIDVLAPNYMTKPPVLPDFQMRNAVTRRGSTINMSEQVNGVTFAGVRFEFLIYPQEPGAYALPAQQVTVAYAADPPASRDASVAVPGISFTALIPDGAETLDPFVSATRLTLRQDIKPSSDPLKVGDSVVRTVTIEAEGTPAMLLPPPSVERVEGTQAYPAQPEFHDRFDSRTDVLVSRRVDQVTYMLERPGEFRLPALDIGWWNTKEKRVGHARTDAVTLSIAENPQLRSSPPPPPNILKQMAWLAADHPWIVFFAVILAVVTAWLTVHAITRLRALAQRRRETYRQSEAFAFANFRAAARSGDAKKTYFALLGWAAHVGAEPNRGLKPLRAAARNPELNAGIASIEQHVYGRQPGAATWSSQGLIKSAAAFRRAALLRHPIPWGRANSLPAELNPSSGETPLRAVPGLVPSHDDL